VFKKASSIFIVVAIIFFPKCPLCWLAYFSFASAIGLTIPYSPWALPILYVFLVVLTVSVYFKSKTYKIQSVGILALGISVLYGQQFLSFTHPAINGLAFSILLCGIFLEPILIRRKKRINISNTKIYK
jgi:hypothetical protein